jgi:FdhE protein
MGKLSSSGMVSGNCEKGTMKGAAGIDIDGIPEIVNVRRPVPARVFASRAARFRSLAHGNVLHDYLGAMALLADAQHAALTEVHFARDIKPLHGEFPVHANKWHRDGAWHLALTTILSRMEPASLPSPARAAQARLSARSSEELESSADALLAGHYSNLELSSATFMGSALQVYWTALACMIAVPIEARSRHACPVCASPPVAGVVLGDSKLRYLVCGLCSTEWYLPRLTCANCGSTEGVAYFRIESDTNGAKAECCSQCRTYLKLFYLESIPFAEPFADDAATLALDTLVSEEGFFRTGPNIYLLPGAGS